MGNQYRRMQTVKHALQYYITRPGASEKDLVREKNLIKTCWRRYWMVWRKTPHQKERGEKINEKSINHISKRICFNWMFKASRVNWNIREDANNFKITRKVVALNTRTNDPLFTVEGKISLIVMKMEI